MLTLHAVTYVECDQNVLNVFKKQLKQSLHMHGKNRSTFSAGRMIIVSWEQSVSIQKRLFMTWNTKVGVAVIKQGSKTCISINIYTWNLLYLTCTTSCTPDFLCKSGHVQVQSYMSPGKVCFLFLPFLQRDWISHPPTCKNLRGSQCIFIFP